MPLEVVASRSMWCHKVGCLERLLIFFCFSPELEIARKVPTTTFELLWLCSLSGQLIFPLVEKLSLHVSIIWANKALCVSRSRYVESPAATTSLFLCLEPISSPLHTNPGWFSNMQPWSQLWGRSLVAKLPTCHNYIEAICRVYKCSRSKGAWPPEAPASALVKTGKMMDTILRLLHCLFLTPLQTPPDQNSSLIGTMTLFVVPKGE